MCKHRGRGTELKNASSIFTDTDKLRAMIGDIGYQNLDQRAGSTPSVHMLLVNRRQNASRTAQEMCLQGQEQLLIRDEAGSNFDCN